MKGTPMKSSDRDAGRRLGAAVRRARLDEGFTNREDFAEHCNVSVRVLADLEAGTRTNFSPRIIAGLEAGIGWPAGTIARIAADPTFEPPAPGSADWLSRDPVFNRRPVPVDVAVIKRALAILNPTYDAAAGRELPAAEAAMAKVLLEAAWPYVTRLLEDNCRPGKGLHPSVKPYWEPFQRISEWLSPGQPAAHYARWLVGEISTLDEVTLKAYTRRWAVTRRMAG